jgi:hypothetical protein
MVQTANSPANVRFHGASRLVQPKGRCRLSALIVGKAMHLSPLHLTNQAVRIPYLPGAHGSDQRDSVAANYCGAP